MEDEKYLIFFSKNPTDVSQPLFEVIFLSISLNFSPMLVLTCNNANCKEREIELRNQV